MPICAIGEIKRHPHGRSGERSFRLHVPDWPLSIQIDAGGSGAGAADAQMVKVTPPLFF